MDLFVTQLCPTSPQCLPLRTSVHSKGVRGIS
jgi:hypothetical protein